MDTTHFPVSAIRPWVSPDPAVYAQLSTINSIISSIESAWIDEEASHGTTISVTGGGTFSGGTVIFNRYKLSLGQSVFWQLSFRNYTIAGSVNTISVQAPYDLYTGIFSGGTWYNEGYHGWAVLLVSGGPATTLGYQLITNPSGIPILEFTLFDGSSLPTGSGIDIDVTVLTDYLV